MSDIQDWKRIEPTTTQKVGFRTIVSKNFQLPDGTTNTFDIADREGLNTAAVIALTPDNKVIITRQFRPGPEKVMDEIPGGMVDDGETPEQAVRRELQEETGYQAGTLEFLGNAYFDAYSNVTRYYFLATGCIKTADQELGDHEFIEIDAISINQLIENAKTGKMTDSTAVLQAYDKLEALQKEGR